MSATDPSPVTTPAAAPEADTKPVTRKFRRSNAERIPPEIASRQGRIAGLAWKALGGRDAAMAFLNEPDATLDARPLDVAIASDEGYDRVAAMIADRASGG